MAVRYAGFVVVGDVVTVVDAEVEADPTLPITINSDDTWRLQKGDKAAAFAVLHQRCSDYLRENKISTAVIKKSAVAKGSAGLPMLNSAEVRGVVTAAAGSRCTVHILAKAVISRTYGDRKVDEYLQDDSFWREQIQSGSLRKTSREAALLILAARSV